MHPALLQFVLAVAMFVTTAVAGFIPIKVVKILDKKGGGENGKGAKWLSLLSCFSGGVFMATCFLDIVPHINETYTEFQKDIGRELEFPLPQLFTCIGFFLVYLIEEVCIRIFAMPHGHGHSHNSAPPAPVNDIRRGSVNLRKEDPLLDFSPEEEKRLERALSIHRFSMVMEETAAYAVAESSEATLLKSLTFAVAMSFHSILEGFALGVQDSLRSIVTLFLSLLLHKGIEAFSVGLQVSKGNSGKMKAVVTTILIYALMTPLGSGLGTLLRNSHIDPFTKDGVVLILESLAAGTFIYVTFLEVLAHEKDNEHNSLVQLLAIFIGFAVIAILQMVFGDHDGHGGHSHAQEEASTLLTTLMTPKA